jgi:putative redox protein
MATTAFINYLGELRTEAKHLLSGNQIITDAPLDNHGKGEAFSPTDLLATSLVACQISIMGIVCNTHSIDMGKVSGTVEKIMAANPRRVSELNIAITFEGGDMSDKEKSMLEHAAHTCPVAQSIHPDIKVNVVFLYR